METEDKKMLQEALSLSRENNKMLHRIRGVQKRQAVWNMIKILLILGVAFGLFYFLEPYFEKMMNFMSSISNFGQNLDSATPLLDVNSLGEVLKNI